MHDTAEVVTFWIFAIPLVATALGVIFSKNPVYAAMNLVAAFFFLAGIYILLVAHLIAFMQILVYAGAVMVLFLFVIMLLSIGDEHMYRERRKLVQYAGVAGGLGILAVLATAVWRATPPGAAAGSAAERLVAPTQWASVDATFGTVKAVGQVLYTEYLLPFEVTSLLLLVAIVGAVVVAKERI